jgi:cation:H+ antiporter
LSDFLISTTIIAIGTSLPELVTSVAAARKKSVDLAVGNIIGSNIFNIFWIL